MEEMRCIALKLYCSTSTYRLTGAIPIQHGIRSGSPYSHEQMRCNQLHYSCE